MVVIPCLIYYASNSRPLLKLTAQPNCGVTVSKKSSHTYPCMLRFFEASVPCILAARDSFERGLIDFFETYCATKLRCHRIQKIHLQRPLIYSNGRFFSNRHKRFKRMLSNRAVFYVAFRTIGLSARVYVWMEFAF